MLLGNWSKTKLWLKKMLKLILGLNKFQIAKKKKLGKNVVQKKCWDQKALGTKISGSKKIC